MKRVNIVNSTENFTALSNTEIVSKLQALSFNSCKNINEFMVQYARRTVIATNQDIRATNVDDFVADLIKFRHIEIIDDTSSLN